MSGGWRDALAECRRGRNLRATAGIALVVGTVLFAINQLDVVISGKADGATIAKIVLTYLVPFFVSNYGIAHAVRHSDVQVRDSPPTEASRPRERR